MHIDETLSLVDHRIYTIALRKMPEFLDVFDRLAMPILLETLGNPIGIYTSHVGPLNQVVHLWAYKDLADYQARCLRRDTHPDFPAYLEASSHLIVAQENRLLTCARLPSMRERLQ
ncbi:NIPSNAP family protein [Castellaniella denitrificans]|jgi:hypothetical protein|uniref:NIPSNAP family protein n=1 Tax=Castellaniella denitrificans TaxID=56119 RepID=UPI001AD3CEC2|nr:NIPSNAP family protein [Burkholderiales bacterium]